MKKATLELKIESFSKWLAENGFLRELKQDFTPTSMGTKFITPINDSIESIDFFFVKRHNDGGGVRLKEGDLMSIEISDVSCKTNTPLKAVCTFKLEEYDGFCMKAVKIEVELSVDKEKI